MYVRKTKNDRTSTINSYCSEKGRKICKSVILHGGDKSLCCRNSDQAHREVTDEIGRRWTVGGVGKEHVCSESQIRINPESVVHSTRLLQSYLAVGTCRIQYGATIAHIAKLIFPGEAGESERAPDRS